MAIKLMVRMVLMTDYLNKKEGIVKLALTALENWEPYIFFRVRSAHLKESVIHSVDDMWVHAQGQRTKAAEIRYEVDNVSTAIRQTEALIDATPSYNIIDKLIYKWRLFRLLRTSFPLTDILTMHFAENGYKPEEKEELLIRLGQCIVTADDIAYRFDAVTMRNLAPQKCISEVAHIPSEALPFLKKFCNRAKEKRYNSEQMIEAWNRMMEMKSRNVDCSAWDGMLSPDEALYVLFEHLTYNEVKKHYLAFIGLTANNQLD